MSGAEPTYYVYVITSRNNPIYEEFDKIRRKQMEDLQIPHKFLLNGALPPGYSLKDDEVYYPEDSVAPWGETLTLSEAYTPGMFLKFYAEIHKGLPQVDFIIRINSSTFVDFRKLGSFLKDLPKRIRVRAGYPLTYYPTMKSLFIAGYAMIFSRDVLENIKYDEDIIKKEADDVALSFVTNDYCRYCLYDLGNYLEFFINGGPYIPEAVDPKKFIFRILNPDRRVDIQIWNELYRSVTETNV